MALRPTLGRLGRAGAAMVLALAALSPVAGPAQGAGPTLPAPTAKVTFLDGITFTGSATLTAGVARVEIILDIEGSRRSFVADVATRGGPGAASLSYVFLTPGGSMLPNTTIVAHFRATLDDGTTVDGPSSTVRYDDDRYRWITKSGEFVTVHWTEGGTSFGNRAIKIADDAIRDVSTLLGVEETDPIDFYVYAERNAFYEVLGAGARENVGGEAHPDIRTLFANIGPDIIDDPWVGIVIPHELTHLVFDTAVANPYHYPPRWLNEGIAVYLSESYGSGDRSLVEDAVRSRTLMPLDALAGQFPTTADQFFLAYAESVSSVDFLVRTYGKPAMVTLVRKYADGVTDDEAFQAALGTDVAGFQAAWLESLGATAPSPYGPADAPAGPVPSDWLGGGPIPGEIPGESASPGPGASPASGSTTGGIGIDGTAILVAVFVAGLVIAGIGLFLSRWNRSIATRLAGDAPVSMVRAPDDGVSASVSSPAPETGTAEAVPDDDTHIDPDPRP
jgi:hypothetical protein